MRAIPSSLQEKINKANQTIYENANPRMDVHVFRAKNTINDTDLFYVETIREKSGLSDISVAMYRPNPNADPTHVYEIHNENGIIKTTLRDLSDFKADRWKPQFDVGPGKACSIEFNGYWVKNSSIRYDLITESKPWIFWTDSSNILYAQKWDDAASRFQVATDVLRVATMRGWKNVEFPALDQGLICAYIKSDGLIYYRNYCEQDDGTVLWESERQMAEAPSPAQSIGLFRTNDYRTGFLVESNGYITWLLTSRAWAGMAIGSELINVSLSTSLIFTKINKLSSNTDDRINISLQCSLVMLYGLSPVPVKIENMDAFTIKITFDEQVSNMAGNEAHVSVVDSDGISFTVNTTAQGSSTKELILNCVDFNAAFGDVTVSYSDGSLTGEAGQAVDDFNLVFAPVGLVPPVIEPPVVVQMWNE
jgi:hypothetical protein